MKESGSSWVTTSSKSRAVPAAVWDADVDAGVNVGWIVEMGAAGAGVGWAGPHPDRMNNIDRVRNVFLKYTSSAFPSKA